LQTRICELDAFALGCSDLSPRAGTIGPGEDVTIHIGVRLDKAGSDKVILVSIECDDPGTNGATYHVMVRCPAPFQLTPLAIQFGSVAPGTSRKAVVRVKPLSRAFAFKATVDSSFIELSRSKTSATDETLTVHLLASAPQGPLLATVTLRTDDDVEMKLPIMADVVDPLVAAPSMALLRLGPDGRIVPINIVVTRLDGQPIGELSKVDLPDGFTLRELTTPSGTRRCYRLESVAGSELHSATVRMSYDNGPMTTAVRLVAPAD
jgi:hypothetical protein